MSESLQSFHSCYKTWTTQQQADLQELLSAVNSKDPSLRPDDQILKNLITKNLDHYRDYTVSRAEVAKAQASALFAPKWNSSFENAHLWIAGCRPTKYFRLLYVICGHEVETWLEDYIQGLRIGSLGALTCEQLNKVNELQGKTILEEDRLTKIMIGLQEEVADQPLALLATKRLDFSMRGIDALVEKHESGLREILMEADKLRFNTLRELLDEIFSPTQAVDFLIAAKQLYFCVHELGLRSDQQYVRD